MQFTTNQHTQSIFKPPVSIRYAHDAQRLKLDPAHTLAMIQFGAADQEHLPHTDVHVYLPALSANTHFEIWETRDALVEGNIGSVTYRKNDDIMFCRIQLDESQFNEVADVAEHAYNELVNCTQQLGFTHLIRVWNYFKDLTEIQDNEERYQSFSAGRYKVYTQLINNFERYLPSASVIGTDSGDMCIYLLATRKPGIQVENPRQVSAFRYPEQYGRTSPSFSRATLKHWQDMSQLFISGTASIVGHETQHEENVLVQLEETLKNLDSLIQNVRDTHQYELNGVNDMSLMKVYIRDPEHYDIIEKALRQRVSKDIPCIFLKGDICRENLLVEIEGIINIYHD